MDPQHKLLWHGSRVENWLSGKNVAPILVEISPVGYCNASCPWCFFKDQHTDKRISTSTMLRTLQELADIGVKAINWTGGGEPTLHPSFDIFTHHAHKYGLKQGLFTNAYLHINNTELFDWIRISLTDKEYGPIHTPNGFFGICVNMLESTTENQLRRWCVSARNIGAGYFQVRPALTTGPSKQPKLTPPYYLREYNTDSFKALFTEYKFHEATSPRTYDKCYGYNLCPSIDWNGNLGVCMYRMQESKYIIGSLESNTFGNLWENKKVSDDLVDGSCQVCCKNHEINKVLFSAKQLKHINFI